MIKKALVLSRSSLLTQSLEDRERRMPMYIYLSLHLYSGILRQKIAIGIAIKTQTKEVIVGRAITVKSIKTLIYSQCLHLVWYLNKSMFKYFLSLERLLILRCYV